MAAADATVDVTSARWTKADWRAWENRLRKGYGIFTLGLIAFIAAMWLAERAGLPRPYIAGTFIVLSFSLYAVVGIANFTRKFDEYYVAGRKVPAFFNGMATGADWMSGASFVSMAGAIWATGYDYLAYIMGWTGGYVLLALFFAPYIRKFGKFTMPDLVAERFPERGKTARVVAAICAIVASFTYVTAQVVAVGVIMGYFFGVPYNIGVFLGLAGVVLCSFLGGMKSITWTQVAQYIILIVAYLLPVTVLSQQLTGFPLSELMYGQAIQNILRLEAAQNLPSYVEPFKQPLSNALAIGAAQQIGVTPPPAITCPSPANAAIQCAQDWRGTPWAFLALTFTLMVGTVGLPHILVRYYTVPNPKDARMSVGWSLFFIYLLYFTAPAYAAFSRWEMLQTVVGQQIASLPAWTQTWSQTGLFSITDRNGDGILQFAEMTISPDLIVLATPEIAGLPYVVSSLVAAGGLAAALSTADGLLLVLASAVSHDIYANVINPNASYGRKFLVSRVMLLVAAAAAAFAALPRLALIAQMVSWAFSFAAATFFPVLLMGIFWRRANANGAIAGMIGGLAVTLVYMAGNYLDPRFNILGITHLASGLFGMIVNFALTIVVSLATAPPPKEAQDLVDSLRIPVGEYTEAPGVAGPTTVPAPAPAR